ncbi:MAG: hypothetical protein QOJ00_2212 [Actinomycetota bacterium]
MRLARLGFAAGVAALVVLAIPGARPALATNNIATITSPNDTAYDAYPPVTGSVTESGNSAVVTHVDLTLTSVDGWTSENQTLSYNRGASNSPVFTVKNAGEVDFNWTPTPRYNGRYTISVGGNGEYNGGLSGTQKDSSGTSRSFNIRIKPAKPTNVAAGMPDGSTEVTVTWSPNPEPDLLGYAVLRSYQNGNARQVGGPIAASSKPTYHEDLGGEPPGAYKYAVVAVRKERTCKPDVSDADCTGKLQSDQSAYSSSVTVRATPGTTTTSTTVKKGGTGGGSTGGGSTGGGSTGGGSTGGSTGGTKGGSSGSSGGRGTVSNGGYAPGGNVDLSQFGSLLTGGSKTTKKGDATDEGTYDPQLKGYDSAEKSVGSGRDNSLITIGGASLPRPSDDWVRFIGLGSLVTALLVHVLWFKQQVDSIPLEAITE